MELKEFDPLEILNTEERLIDYLNAELAEGDPHYIRIALNTIARARDIEEIAKKAGITLEYLNQALSSDGNPDYSTVQKIINALDMHLTVVPNR